MNTRSELGTLEASGLIQVATLDPELEYLFRHALVQDAAYSSLLKQDRRALHRLAADTLLSLYPERKRERKGKHKAGPHQQQRVDEARQDSRQHGLGKKTRVTEIARKRGTRPGEISSD